jgi:plastocyanin
MAKQVINIGSVANDGTGDPIRTAMIKSNDNFTELYNGQFSGAYADLTGKPSIPTDLLGLGIVDGTDGQVLSTDGDGNFAFVDQTGGSSYTNASVDAHLNTITATNNQLLSWTGTDYDWVDAGAGSATFAALTEVNTADLDVHDIAVQAKTTLVVTANGTAAYRFDINGATDNPTVYVRAGETIAFDLTGLAGSHPFQIETNAGAAFDTGLIHIADNGTKTTGSAAQGKTAGTLYWKVPASISGTYEYQCTAHAGMNGNIEIEPVAGAGGGGVSLGARSAKAGTTASLANNATGNLDITGFKGYALISIQTSAAAWVRIYANGATRTADASRLETSDPAPDAGVIAEVITTGAQTVLVSPGAIGYNAESTPTTNIPCAVKNKSGSAAAITVTLTVIQLEA